MTKISYYTQEGFSKLQNDLTELKTTQRAKIALQLEEARSKGDLSENAEYDAAKDAQAMLELKIAKLEETMANARVLNENNLDISKVSILTKVKIKNQDNGSEVTYMIVAEEEANLSAGKISVTSPIGKGLLGKKVGDTAFINTPSGKVSFKIMEISR